MTTFPNKRRLLQGAAGLALITAVVVVVARLALTGLAVDALLRMAGASEIKFSVTQASPWRVVVENLDFRLRTQAFAAKRLVLQRTHWWTPSLGAVRVEQARLPLNIDGSDTNPWAWSTYKNGTAAAQPVKIPADEISIDGQLVVQAAALADQTLTVKIEARLTENGEWNGRARADGPGLGLKAEGTFNPATNVLTFKVPEASVDLKPWQGFIQRMVLLPAGPWELEGKLSGSAEGKWADKHLMASGVVQVRDGRIKNEPHGVSAEGIEADLQFIDFEKVRTRPGTLRIRELRTGRLPLREIDAEVAFESAEKIAVTRIALKALGGSLAAEPFKYFFNLRELDAVLLAEGVSVEEVMALTQDLPAKATGRVNGRLPVHIDAGGLRLGTGWLALKSGVYAEVQFNAGGLLTSGMPAGSPSYAVLKKIESGLLKLKVGELRLDIRPPNAPSGRSAQLHLVGEPVDPEVKAPVTLDLNVNGPLERLLNLGLDSRVKFGSKP
jgi:hypothetical protein